MKSVSLSGLTLMLFGVKMIFAQGPDVAAPSRARLSRRQDGPVDPGTAPDCTWFDTAYDDGYTCDYFVEGWGIKLQDFIEWNPSLGSDCQGLKVGNSYCVEVNNGLPRPTTSSKITSSSTTTSKGDATPTESGKPSPTQDGLIESCTVFYKAVKGDNCDRIVKKYGTFTFDDFYKWNPAVEEDCSAIWLDTYYCVGVPGTPTAPPKTTTATTTTSTGTPKPSPTQEGLIKSCVRFHKAIKGDTCDKIVNKYGPFTLADFYKWNPAVNTDCSALLLDTYYCVGIPTTPTTTTKATTSTTTTKGNGIATPTPTQPSMVGNCDKFTLVKKDDTCDSPAKKFGITVKQLGTWNPEVGNECKGLWANAYACVHVRS